VAYYFVALALGLVGGLHPDPMWLTPALSALLVAVMYAADHPRFARQTFRQTVTLDVAHPNQETLKAALGELLGAQVLHVVVQELDMVRDLTIVDVRFRILPTVARHTTVSDTEHVAQRDEILAAVG
jgi:hypothetical protein